jgi:hypothetical protein
MSLALTVRAMVAAGCTAEQVAAVAAAYEAEAETKRAAKRANGAARQQRYRERNASDALHASRNASDALPPSPKKEIPPTPPKEKTTLSPSTPMEANASMPPLPGGDKKTPREILLECPLRPEVADGVLAHRKALRKPLTGRAAQLLVKGFLSTADPNAAADMMIARGWQGFRAEWYENEARSNGKQPGKGSIVEAGRRLTARLVAEREERELRAGKSGGEGDPVVRLLPSQRGQ